MLLALLVFWVKYAHCNAKMSDFATFYAYYVIMLNAKWTSSRYMYLKTWLQIKLYHTGHSIRIVKGYNGGS